ncbi:MAG: hypothetical protein JWN71_1866, partial [Xanthobacteraceae bacterium]|nr:hypothetical protein [Xanthobacteraceae bacterium]
DRAECNAAGRDATRCDPACRDSACGT